jgi:uncharacterized membrane protein
VTERTQTGRAPYLASDISRGIVAIVPAFVVAVLFPLVAPGLVEAVDAPIASTLLGWVAYGVAVVILTWVAFGRASAGELARRLAATEPSERLLARILWIAFGGGAVLWAVSGSAIAVIAVVYLALHPSGDRSTVFAWAAVLAIASSWALTANAFAVRYARENVRRGGAEFPGPAAPEFSDYVYLAIQLGTTFAGSDVQFTTKRMRRTAAVHSVLSFAFNSVIVALLVSVLLTRIG